MANIEANQQTKSTKDATREGSIQEARTSDPNPSKKKASGPLRVGSIQEARAANTKKAAKRPKSKGKNK